MTHHESAAEPAAGTTAPAPAVSGPAAPPAAPFAAPSAAAAPPTAATAPAGSGGSGESRFDMVAWAVGRVQRRRERIAAEIERNRRGEPAVPTWILAVALVAILGAWAALVMLS